MGGNLKEPNHRKEKSSHCLFRILKILDVEDPIYFIDLPESASLKLLKIG